VQRTTEAVPRAPVVPGEPTGRAGGLDRLIGSRASRSAWAVVSFVLAAVLALAFVLAGKAVHVSEQRGQDRAAQIARTTLDPALTSDQLERPIVGDRHDQLVQLAKDQIFSDDLVARVRIWNPGHVLVFSTHPRDLEGSVAADTAAIDAAMGGEVVSHVTEPRPPQDGLAGSAESMYVTFVPMRLGDRAGVAGVVEVDQHEGAMTRTARWLWRGVQVLAALLLVGALGMLVLSLRTAPTSARAPRRASATKRDGSAREIRRLKTALAERGAALETARKETGALVDAARQEMGAEADAARKEAEDLGVSLKAAEARAVQAEARVAELEAEQVRLNDELERAHAGSIVVRASAEAPPPLPEPVVDPDVDGAEPPDDVEVEGLLVEEFLVDVAALEPAPLSEGVPPPRLQAVPEVVPERWVEFEAAPDGPGEDAPQAWGPVVDATPPQDPDDDGGLSLRARLARAAAARHRFAAEAEEGGDEERPLFGDRR
jgi:hypothetical protein